MNGVKLMGLRDDLFGNRKWKKLLEELRNRELPPKEIGSAIVKLGKPLRQKRILAAKDVIAPYLDHEDNWVRHEAMWFLTSWGGLHEFQPALISALKHDPFVDNRSYAAICLGRLNKGRKNAEAIAALKAAVEDNQEDGLVRKDAYCALLAIVKNQSVDSSAYDRQLSEIDWGWVSSLGSDSLPSDPRTN